MAKLITLLLLVAVFSVAHGWFETKFTITGRDCVASINEIARDFDPIKKRFVATSIHELLMDKFREIAENAKQELKNLIPQAKELPNVDVYYHEIRIAPDLGVPIQCSQDMAYSVAEILWNALEQASYLTTTQTTKICRMLSTSRSRSRALNYNNHYCRDTDDDVFNYPCRCWRLE